VTTTRSDARRLASTLVALAVVAASFLVGSSSASAATASPAEAAFTARLNAARTSHSVARLTVRSDLVAVARAQAVRMANRSVLYHNPRLTTAVKHWRWVGENVGYGPDAGTVHTAFMNSPPHRANILDRDYTEIGIGTVTRAGRVWVAEVFRRPLRVAHLTAGFVRPLHIGSQGRDVRLVQAELGLRVTSRYDARTARAVARFQRTQGWAGHGQVGPRTWQRLF
jgi:uncharacterized protein YkwD